MTHPTSSDRLAQLAELLAKASWRLRRSGKKELAALGLTFGQARALRIIAREAEPLRIGDLAARLEIVPRSATTTVDALEAAGLVARQPDPQDRRSVLLQATAEGLALLARMDAQRRESATALFAGLDEAERDQLLGLLGKLFEPEAEVR
jgi:DNA-binding MarR family transcriptional regulator